MNQMQIVLGIVLTLALCYGAVLASGEFEAGNGNDTAGVEPVIAGSSFASQSIPNATNTTENATRNATLEGSDPLPGRTAMPHEAALVQRTSGDEDGMGGGSSGASSLTPTPAENATLTPALTVKVSITDSGITPKTITVLPGTTIIWTNEGSVNQTITGTGTTGFFDSGLLKPGESFIYMFTVVGNCTYTSQTTGKTGAVIVTPNATPTVEPTPSQGDTSSSPTSTPPTANETVKPAPDPAENLDPDDLSTCTVTSWIEPGVADVTRTHYEILDQNGVMHVIVETEFPELDPAVEFYNEMYYFIWRELSYIYSEYHSMRQMWKNGVGHSPWPPIGKTAILVYSEEATDRYGRRYYAISDIDFTKEQLTGDKIPFRLYWCDDNDTIPEQTPTKPRYFEMPRDKLASVHHFVDRACPDRFSAMPYHGKPQTEDFWFTTLSVNPTSELTPEPTPGPTVEPTPELTAEPGPLPPAETWTPSPISDGTPEETPTPEQTHPLEISTETPAETLVEPQEPPSMGPESPLEGPDPEESVGVPEEIPESTPETPELIEEPTPAKDGNETV
jgi:plastocyanin